MSLAVIPARGGSKRIPRKNLKPFAGRPIIAWTIEAARQSGLFERILVSTDDREIAALAAGLGAEVPFVRPAELADDHAGTAEVIAHAAQWATAQGSDPAAVCCLYATAPFLTSADLVKGHDLLLSGQWDYVFAAAQHRHAVFRAFVRSGDGAMEMLFPEHRLTRSQDLPPAFYDAAQFYWGQTEAWVGHRPIFGAATTFVELPPERVQDIDTPEDWAVAEEKFANFKRNDHEQR